MKAIIAFLVSCCLMTVVTAKAMPTTNLTTFPVNEQIDVPIDSLIKVYSSTPGSGDFMFSLYDTTTSTYVDGHSYLDISGVVFKPYRQLNSSSRYVAQYSSLTNRNQRVTWAFTTAISVAKPIGSFSINNDEADVNIYAKVELRLDADLNGSDIEVSLTNKDTQENIDINLTNSQSLVLISPASPLDNDTTYELTASSTIVEFSQPLVISFSTETKSTQTVDNIHIPSELSGYTFFNLIPHPTIQEQSDATVTFGAPFPKGFVNNNNNIRILDEENNELPIAVISTLEWLSDTNDQKSIRSAVIQLEVDFTGQDKGRLLKLAWGEERSTTDLEAIPIDNTWLAVDDEEFSLADGIREPNAYALFSADWYGKSVIKNRVLPLNSNHQFSAYDAAFYAFGKTAINHVDPRVVESKLLPYKTSYAAWLFDRAMTLYQLAFRTGELKFLRSAHRASQFYKSKISEQGYFSLKPSNDMKYSYGESLVSNYILTGDPSIPSTIESMVPVWDTFTTFYTVNTNFWTERHAAFQLKGYTAAYEITNKEEYKVKAEKVFEDLRAMQSEPSSGVPTTGALMHTSSSHGEFGPYFIASPWMSTLLVDAVERFSIHVGNSSVPNFIVDMAKYFQTPDVALWEWTGYKGDESYIVPHYLAGESLTPEQHGGGGGADVEHAPDVSKLFSAAYYYSCKLGNCDDSFIDTFAQLRDTQNIYTFPYWMRLSAPNQGYTAYRLSPPRKFNWWFNASANNDFLLGNTSDLHMRNRESSELNLSISQKVIGPANFIPGAEYIVKLTLKNESEHATKNIFIQTDLQRYSPVGLAEVVSISDEGFDRSGSVVWKVASLPAGESTGEYEFRFKINEFPVLLTESRQLDDIIIKSRFKYCLETSVEPECVVGTKNWDLGSQDFEGFSNWHSISVARPDTPPNIEITSLNENDSISGVLTLTPTIEDEQGISKVQFWLDGELLEETSELPYSVSFDADILSNQIHQLTVRAWDKIGSKASKSVNFYSTNPDVSPPTLTLIQPDEGAKFCDSFEVLYTADDNSGLNYCSLGLDGSYVTSNSCNQFFVPIKTVLFKAQEYLSFNNSDKLFSGINESKFKGDAYMVDIIEGPLDNAIRFLNSDSYIRSSEHGLSVKNNMSVSFWINPSEDQGIILSQDWYYIGREYGWAIALGSNNHRNTNAQSISWASGSNTRNANERNVVQTDSNVIPLHEWTHVVIVKNDKRVKIYINGELAKDQEIAYAEIAWPHTSSRQISFAEPMKKASVSYNKGFVGAIDEVAIWDFALSDSEITQLFSSTPIESSIELELSATDNAKNTITEKRNISINACLN